MLKNTKIFDPPPHGPWGPWIRPKQSFVRSSCIRTGLSLFDDIEFNVRFLTGTNLNTQLLAQSNIRKTKPSVQNYLNPPLLA